MGAEVGVEARQAALEAFAARRARAFLQERTLRLDLTPWLKSLAERARALVAHIPPEVRQQVVDFAAAEARGRRKKLRQMMPLLLVGGMKMVGVATLMYLSIGFLAKKAFLLSLLSLLISGFIAVKKVLQQPHPHHYEAYPVHGGGWAGGGGGGGGTFDISGYSGAHAEYTAHSAPVGHAVAYSAHKPGAR
ncbi:Uncharacterized protein GBIM_16968 [Gryllus bimaculatus]|nr:Uncharacterized protein GBIM_16968 [Gryllus bimaculatus]